MPLVSERYLVLVHIENQQKKQLKLVIVIWLTFPISLGYLLLMQTARAKIKSYITFAANLTVTNKY